LSSQWSLEARPSLEGGEVPREVLDLPVGGSSKLLDGDAENNGGFDSDAAPSTTPCCTSSSRNGKNSSWEFSLASPVAAELLLVVCKSLLLPDLGLNDSMKLWLKNSSKDKRSTVQHPRNIANHLNPPGH
jgi:hypothetical protein